ncbi:hypothetical protein C2E16_11865 [Mixta calida]|uniref:Uncharacterized protein n=1 Tax=Mixta calida TaxID=665913 RepID=A0ABM6S1V2_9GAMM|nr:hypothetical protein C2E16_11865 [Mixta calida]
MTRFKYSLTMLLPAFIVCWPIGKSAKAIERIARKVRLKCAYKMRDVLAGIPTDESKENEC